AGSENIGLHATVTGRSAARKVAHAVGVGLDTVSRPNGDHSFRIARIGDADGAKLLDYVRVIAQHSAITEVAGRGYHHHARCQCLLRFHTDRGLPACKSRRIMRDRKTHVDTVNVKSLRVRVQVAQKLKGGDDDEFFARAVWPAHSHIDQIDVAAHPK